MPETQPTAFSFGEFRIETAERRLVRGDIPLALTPKAFETLLVLVENRGRLVPKEEFLQRVWPNTHVTEVSLARNISALRKALGDDGEEFIETVSKFGYRFRSPVTEAAAPSPGQSTTALAVLPFASVGVSEANAYLELGLADALITRLSTMRRVAVRPTGAIRRYAGTAPDLAEAGRELKVSRILEGTVQVAGDRLRVTVRLVEVERQHPVWAEKFDEPFSNIFTIQDSISEKVAQALLPFLTESERASLSATTVGNPKAHQHYLKGRYAWTLRTGPSLEAAFNHFSQAIEIAPDYALAHAGLADCCLSLLLHAGVSPREYLPRAKAAATRAIELAPDLAEGYIPLAMAKLCGDWDFEGAGIALRRGLELKPNFAHGRHWHSQFLITVGRNEEAVAEARRALELDPLSLMINQHLADMLYISRDYETAAEQLRDTLDMNPDFVPALHWLGLVYSKMENHAEAIRVLERGAELCEGNPRVIADLGCVYAAAGRIDDALAITARLDELADQRHVSPIERALLAGALGKKDEAFDQLENAFAERHFDLLLLKVWPGFDPLRDDPRMDAMLERIGL
jgi:TolB-like protein/Flp pilus assembly protein TadD